MPRGNKKVDTDDDDNMCDDQTKDEVNRNFDV